MCRTHIDLDDDLIAEVMRRYGVGTDRVARQCPSSTRRCGSSSFGGRRRRRPRSCATTSAAAWRRRNP
ncbi:MAG: type II toxin-antitoxin system VapB family antitoxin [Actinomycetaceae bacterium]